MRTRILTLGLLLLPSLASAASLAWDRNQTDLDIAKYTVYGCFTPGCTVTESPATTVATVTQPASGIVPSVTVVIAGKTGAFAVSASDLSGNESGLSVSVPFDAQAPTVPLNPRLLP